jgi:hypothetical protein
MDSSRSLRFDLVYWDDGDGRWIAKIESLSVRETGTKGIEALSKAEAAALRVVADQIEKGQPGPDLGDRIIKFEITLGRRLSI